ncbi:MAG TPA: hypothetical protein VHS35_08325 [Pseudonocardia sp.]|nr:hypothetical protein [Pseudonocardia sp.]
MPERAEDASAPVDPRLAAALVDVFVYVVVLNLFVEYLPQVLSETDAGAGGRAEAPPRLGPRRLDLNPTPGSTVRP